MGSPQNLPSNGGNAALPPNPKGKKRKQSHSTSNFASNDKDTELSPDSNSCKRRRGSTFLPDVIKDRSSGVRREVHYNKRGQTIGETKPKYSSWLGVLARTMVPIDREWKKVTNENKNKLWECVQLCSQSSRLAVGSLDNIVAHGEMFEKVGPEEVVHTVPLGDAYVRVYIGFVIKKDAILPVPIAGEVSIVGEATGYYVAWPKNLVLLGDEGGLKNHEVTGNKGASKNLGVAANKGAAQTYTPRWDDNQVIYGNVDSNEYLESLRSFNDYVGSLEYCDAYTISVDEEVFGAKVEVPLVKEDMEYMSQMEEVTVSCITLYISHLCRVMKSANIGRRFNFVNPSAIFGTSIKLAGRSKSNLLASLLKDVENDKLVFVPYNLGVHWILLVIDLSSSTIHYLDSLQPEKIQPNIQVIFNAAMRIYDSSKSNPRKRSLSWINVKCPRQPTNVECGFYVMRYMKEVIADESILSKKNFNGKTTYTQAEIDEVRVEWMNCVLEYDI